MSTLKSAALVFAFLLLAPNAPLFCQERSTQVTSPTDRPSIEMQLSLIVASSDNTTKSAMPQALEPVIKPLRQYLPYTNYRLAASFTNRAKSGSTIESRSVLPSDMIFGSTYSEFKSFYEYVLTVNLKDDAVEIPKFRFTIRMPIIMGMSRTEGSAPAPIVNYEPGGLTTELSFREATPTVVGTMTTTKPDQLLIVVISVRRTP